MADELGIMVTELPEATNIGDDDLFYLVQESYSKKTKTRSLKNSILGNVLGTASGQPASFPDGSDNPLEVCIAEIEPVQDLHGYDKPWAGGAGKNIFGYEESVTDETATYRANINQRLIISKVTENEIKCNYKNGNYSEGYLVISGIDGTLPYSISYTIKEKTVTYNPDIIKDKANSDGTKLVLKVRGNNGGNVVGDTEYVTFTNIQVESGTSITSFEPYSNICPINGHSSVTVTISDGETSTTKTTPLGQTVYGGQLNVLTGELTIDKGMVTFDGSEQWQSMANVGYPIAYRLDGNWGAKNVSVGTANGFSNRYEYSLISLPEQGYRFANNNADTLYVYDKNFNNDLAGFKSSLSSINMQMCFELATPQTVQLTPQEVNSILGQNYIEADSGDITVAYIRDLNSCISNIISRIEALEQANSNRSLSLNRSLSKGVEEPQEEVKEEEQEEVNER